MACTVELLGRSLRLGGLMLVGGPYWLWAPPNQDVVEGCHASSRADLRMRPELIGHFVDLGYDVVEMVLADQDSWDRYQGAQWFNLRCWLDQNPEAVFGHERSQMRSAAAVTVPRKTYPRLS
ncbi:hypothetical protein J7E91_35285 [Streptomyces sp. ISL-99]|nr:hypothetical protein [Streptomyces sp. ISL-99]